MSDRFAARLLAWFDQHGRRDLPWQHRTGSRARDAYRVWVSEVMLQQTQVATVIAYYGRFIAALPGLRELAAASEDEVFALWSGLGYYRRARHLHAAARVCMARHGGRLPEDFAALCALPGIGRSTAGAILAQACGQRQPILDANAKRVLARYHGIDGYPGQADVARALWARADEHTPAARVADYTQAIMDLGATLCLARAPRCAECPLAASCVAHREGRTAELPARRPARARPVRATYMLVLRDRQLGVLLERRGPTGVWSGLWSLPEAGDAGGARDLARRHARIAQSRTLAPFTHVFTHYALHVTPILMECAEVHARVGDAAGLRWCTPDTLAALGLPAPVRRLLREINDNAEEST